MRQTGCKLNFSQWGCRVHFLPAASPEVKKFPKEEEAHHAGKAVCKRREWRQKTSVNVNFFRISRHFSLFRTHAWNRYKKHLVRIRPDREFWSGQQNSGSEQYVTLSIFVLITWMGQGTMLFLGNIVHMHIIYHLSTIKLHKSANFIKKTESGSTILHKIEISYPFSDKIVILFFML